MSLINPLQELVLKSGVTINTPFSKGMGRDAQHEFLNNLAKSFWLLIKKQPLPAGYHYIWGVAFHPKYGTPTVVYKAFLPHLNSKMEIYDYLVSEGVEVYCLISLVSTVLETPETILDGPWYYSVGTSFGQETGIWNGPSGVKNILKFSQPQKVA